MKGVQKIAIIGISGSGKSHLARLIAQKTNLPLFHMDSLWWRPNWTEAPEAEVKTELKKILLKNEWIIEGYIEPLGIERLQQADQVIYLDCSPWQSLLGGLQRSIQYSSCPRPEMPIGCVDTFSFSYLKTMFRRAEREEIETIIKKSGVHIIRLKNRLATKKFLNQTFT